MRNDKLGVKPTGRGPWALHPFLFLLSLCSLARADDPPIEVQPTDPAAAKIVLIAGGPAANKPGEHEWFAGSVVLFKMLKQTPGVAPVLVRDGWPKNPETLKGAKAVVFYMDGGGKQPFLSDERMDRLAALMKEGCGLVNLHQVIDYPREAGARITPWLGGAWDKEIGCRGHWVADVKVEPADHPIARGVGPFKIDDGWIFNIRFVGDMKAVTPLVKAVPPEKLRTTADAKKHPGRAEIMAWAFEREGTDGGQPGRAFTFVGGHLHASWADANLRRFVTNGILWAAKVEVPADGAKVEFDPAELKLHLESKLPAKPAPEKKPAEKKAE
jgi:type 1 glutamine amidotransferase